MTRFRVFRVSFKMHQCEKCYTNLLRNDKFALTLSPLFSFMQLALSQISLTHTHYPPLSLSQNHPRSHALFLSLPPLLSLSLTLSHTHTFSLSLSLTHTLFLSLSVHVYTPRIAKRKVERQVVLRARRLVFAWTQTHSANKTHSASGSCCLMLAIPYLPTCMLG